MFLGQQRAPRPLRVEAGEELGKTRNYHTSWDIGVIDSRVTGSFLGKGIRRYPGIKDYLKYLGYTGVRSPYRGQQTKNAASFIRYMTPGLKAAWFRLLLSEPKRHGRAGWDLNGRLRGAWFNSAVDAVKPPPPFDSTRFNTLLFQITGPKKVAVKFDSIPHSASNCAGKVSDEPDATWVVYER